MHMPQHSRLRSRLRGLILLASLTCLAGFAFLFVKPHFHEDTAFIVDPAPDNNNVRSFQNDYQVSPRVWLGWNDGCSGAGWRASYWTYDYDADPQSILGTPANTPISPTATRRGSFLLVRLKSPRPVVPSSPVRV